MGKRSKNQWWIFRQIWFFLRVLLGPKHVWIWYYLIYFKQYSIPLLYITTIKSPFLNVWVSAHQVPHYRLSNALIFEFGAQAADLARPGPFFFAQFQRGRAIKTASFHRFFHGDADPFMPWVRTFLQRQSCAVKLGCAYDWQPAPAPFIEKNAIAEAKMNKSLWWGLDWDNKLSLNGRTFRIEKRLYNVNYWILSRSEHAQLGFVAQFALQRLTFHLTLLTFDKSDLVGINSTHLLLALWCFSPLDPKSWRRYLGWENNLICEKHRNPPWVNSEFYAWTWYNMINIINKIWWYEWNLLKYSLSRNGLAWSHPARQLAKQDQRIMSGLLSGQGWPIFGGKIGKKSPHWL